MIEVLIMIIVLLVVVYVARLVIAELGLPANITKIAYLVVGLIALFWLLSFFGLFTFPVSRMR